MEAIENVQDRKDFIFDSLRPKEMLDIFGRYFFPEIIKGNEAVPRAHRELIRELASPDDSAIIFPRGFAKTTWERIDTIHDVVYALEPVILYISDTLTAAQLHFESIKAEFENNELLIYIYGDLVPEETNLSRKWTNKHFETKNGINVIARGRNKGRGINIKNQRPTKAIADDIEDDEEVQNPEQRQKLHNWIYNVILPSLDKERGRLKIIGTVLHEKAEVLAFFRERGGIFRRAIENGKSIWPKRFTNEDLYKIRDGYIKPNGEKVKGLGTRTFEQEYQNNPTADGLAKIKPEWLNDRVFTVLPAGHTDEVIYIDPQSGEKSKADEYAITTVLWYKKDIHRYVVEQTAGRASQLEQAKEVVRMWLRRGKKARLVGIEVVMTQNSVWQNLRDWKAKTIDFNNKSTPFGSKGWIDESDRNIPITKWSPKGKDKLARLEIFEPAIERGEFHIKPDMSELRDQLCFMGQEVLEHDDRADSAVGALELSFNNVSSDIIFPKKEAEYESLKKGDRILPTKKTQYFGNLFKKKF